MNFKFIASSVGFVGVGAVFGWAITADRAEVKRKELEKSNEQLYEAYSKQARESIQLRYEMGEVQEALDNVMEMIEALPPIGDDENSPEEETVEINTGGEIEEVDTHQDPTDEEIAESRESLQNLINQYAPDTRDQDAFVDRGQVVVESTRYDPPFVIPQSEYAWSEEGNEYAKITLRYFSKQQILLDEDEEPIDDVDAYVGWRNLNRFGDGTDNPDVVYVRNRRLDTDFEVERETEEDLPLHVKYAMPKLEFVSERAAGRIRLAEEDE